MLLSERAARMAAEAEAQARALLIEKLRFAIARLRHERFGQSSERGVLIEQLELQLSDLEENVGASGIHLSSHDFDDLNRAGLNLHAA